MPQYLIGVLSAFGTPFLHGLSNIYDDYLSHNIFKRLTPLVFLSSCTGIVLLPIIFYLDYPAWLPVDLLFIAFCIAAIEVLYMYPYYWSLRKADTSVVAALFSLGRLFVPIFAYFLIGEVLRPLQYTGLALIIASSTFLTLDLRRLRFNPALVLMFFVTAILAVQAVLFKHLFEQGVSWGSGVTWVSVFEFAIAFILVLIPANLRELSAAIRRIPQFGSAYIFNEFLGWTGNMASYYAVFLIPVSVAKAIGSTQPAFVLLFGLL
ncbi:MAG: EamA family transporter, partial [Minisyncoccia bacterium]